LLKAGRVRVLPLTHLGCVIACLVSDPPDANAQQACVPPTVMVVLDKSSSMQTGTIGGQTKWNIAKNALGQVLTGIQDQAEVGLMTFPRPDRCGPGGLDVAPALNTRTSIMNALATPPPDSGFFTPMAQTLEQAALEPTLVTSDAPRYVVLISDGWQWCSPYDPATRYDGVNAVGSLNAAGVTTYVVGFGGATDASALNLMAVEAGTALPGCNPSNDEPSDPNQCYFQADNSAALIAALEQIADNISVETCDGEDNDCDGLVDEGLVRDCASACGTGSETCTNGVWGGCDAPAVETEVCNGTDDDCDGAIDPGCECTIGTTRPCGETSDVGACHPGTQTCGTDGTWGNCEGSVGPTPEMCDGEDNDCDGMSDEDEGVILRGAPAPLLCQPGEVCVGGGCQPEDPVVPPSDEEVPGGQPGGCGCATGGGSRGALGGLLLALGTLAMVAFTGRRRRR
jgi:MYXO-CTERM domain-containing protein